MSSEAWVGLIVGVLGLLSTVIAFRMGRKAEREDQEQQIRGILETIRRDVTRGIECAEAWFKIAKGAPAYRLPVATWESSSALLAGAETFTANEHLALATFFELAAQINHCFNRIEEVDQSFRSAEQSRAVLKISHMLSVEPPNHESAAARAGTAVDDALSRMQASRR